MKSSKKLMSYLLSLSIMLSSQVSTSALGNNQNYNPKYSCQELNKKEEHTHSKKITSLLTKLKNAIIHPASLLIPPGILALVFGGKIIHNHFHSDKSSNPQDKQPSDDLHQINNTKEDDSNQTLLSSTPEHKEKDSLDQQKQDITNQQEQDITNQQEQDITNQQEQDITNQQEQDITNQQEQDITNQQEQDITNQQEQDITNQQEQDITNQQEQDITNQQNKYRQADAIKKANKICEKLRKCVEINNKRNALVTLNGPTIIIGDLHGDIDAAALARDQVDKFLSESDKNNAVFLGDYFNKKIRENDDKSFEVLEIITDLQIKYNNRVVLLRGNHEESYIDFKNFEYCGKFTSGTYIYSANAELIDEKIKEINSTQIKDFCNSLPIAAEITNKNQRVLCLHGFIPSAKNDYSWLDTLRKGKSSDISADIKFPLLCNYYSESQQDETKDKGIIKLTKVDCVCNNTLKKFLENNNYKCLIRGHSHNAFSQKDIFGDGTCYSVHSNPNNFYKANSENSTAGILLFDNNGEIKTKIEYKYCNISHINSRINNLVEVPSHKDSIDKMLKENNKNIISVSPEKFKEIVKNYRGALVFRGCHFENEQAAKNYENILFSDIKKSLSTNNSAFGDGVNYVYFAHNVYRALRYATSDFRAQGPLARVYLAYHLDDTVNDYSENDSVAKNTNDNIVICNKPFELNRLTEKIDVTNLGDKTFGWFRKRYPHVEENIKTWVKECIGEKATENLWSYFLDDLKIEY